MVAKSLLLWGLFLLFSLARTSPLTRNSWAAWPNLCLTVILSGGKEFDLIRLLFPTKDDKEEIGTKTLRGTYFKAIFYRYSNLDMVQMSTVQARSSRKHEPLSTSTQSRWLVPREVCRRMESSELL